MSGGLWTEDRFFDGALQVRQHRRGYRFSIDAVLLAGYAAGLRARQVVELGTGCGIIALILGFRRPGLPIVAVEIQPELADLARRNVADNDMDAHIRILRADVRRLRPADLPRLPDLVLSNPPYRRPGSGRLNPDSQRAVARHEIHLTLADLVATARALLPLGGRFVTIYTAERLTDLLTELRRAELEPKSIRMVHSFAGGPAKRILVDAKRGGRRGVRIDAPLVVYAAEGRYGPEVAGMMAPVGQGGLQGSGIRGQDSGARGQGSEINCN